VNTTSRSIWQWWRIDASACLAGAIITVTLYLVMVSPLANRNAAYAQQQQQLSQQQLQTSSVTTVLTKLRAKLDQVNKELADTPLQLQPANIINRRLADITELARQCNLVIDQIQPGRAQRAGRYDIVPIKLTGKGTFVSAARFFDLLQQRFADSGIHDFELSAQPNMTTSTATFIFELAWYTAPTRRRP
jgi:Tfp pilus assembly protein PilO